MNESKMVVEETNENEMVVESQKDNGVSLVFATGIATIAGVIIGETIVTLGNKTYNWVKGKIEERKIASEKINSSKEENKKKA